MSFDKADLPAQFGAYVLKQKIARGGMAELYLGEAQGPGGFAKPVVIKMIHDAFSKDPRFESMFNAEANMVAGLVHDIGSLAVIGYARDFPDVAENPVALESSIQAMRSQLSGMILSTWEMPEELVTAAKEAENWYREHNGPADCADLVIAAQLHESIGGELDPALVPTYSRLRLSPSEIDLSL